MKTKLFLFFVLSLTLLSCHKIKVNVKNIHGIEKSTEDMDAFFQSLIDSLEIPGLSVAIINDSKIAYDNYFGLTSLKTKDAVTKKTIFEAASLSKPLFASFVMKQVEKGILDLDKPLYEYLPYPDIEHDLRAQRITSRMILSHSSGLPNWRQDSLKIEFMPGTNYMYSGEGYEYLSQVIAKINNVSLNKLDSIFQIEVSNRINAERLYFKWNVDIASNKATGHINNKPSTNKKDHIDNKFSSAGGLHTDAISYAKFLISIFDNSLIASELNAEMLKKQIELPSDDINKVLIGASGWSLGFGLIPVDNTICYFHGGNNDDFQSWMHFYPDQKYGIVLFTNSDKIQSPEFFNMFFEFMNDGIKFDLSKLN